MRGTLCRHVEIEVEKCDPGTMTSPAHGEGRSLSPLSSPLSRESRAGRGPRARLSILVSRVCCLDGVSICLSGFWGFYVGWQRRQRTLAHSQSRRRVTTPQQVRTSMWRLTSSSSSSNGSRGSPHSPNSPKPHSPPVRRLSVFLKTGRTGFTPRVEVDNTRSARQGEHRRSTVGGLLRRAATQSLHLSAS